MSNTDKEIIKSAEGDVSEPSKKKTAESARRKTHIKRCCDIYKINEADVRDSLENGGTVYIVKGLFGYKVIDKRDCATRKLLQKVVAVIYPKDMEILHDDHPIRNENEYEMDCYDVKDFKPSYVVLPDNLKVIDDRVFKLNDKITSIDLPQGIKSIGKEAFYGCSSLNSCDFPASMEIIGEDAYRKSGLTEVNLVQAGPYCCANANIFRGTPIKKIAFGNQKIIGDGAFSNCSSLTSVKILGTVETVGKYAFANCSIENAKICSGVKEIGDGAFSDNPIKKYELCEGVLKIGKKAFYGKKTNITSFTIPSTVEELGENAFNEYVEVTKIEKNDGEHINQQKDEIKETTLEEFKKTKEKYYAVLDELEILEEQLKQLGDGYTKDHGSTERG